MDIRGRRGHATFQARHAQKGDLLRRKLIDNSLFWIGMATDVIRMRVRQTFEGDNTSWIVEKCDVISAVFPPLNDVPYRKINVDEGTRAWELTSLVSQFEEGEQEKNYAIQIPFEYDVDVNDLLFRILLDGAQRNPVIIPIRISEMLGTFGGMKIIMNKFNCAIETDNIPRKVIDTLQQMAIRRKIVGY